jgi:hypothetical protein
MGAYEDRNQLLQLAKEVNQFKLDAIAALAPLNKVVSRLVAEMDRLLPSAADEKSEAPKVRRVRYSKGPTSIEEHEKEAAVVAVAESAGRKKPRKPRKPLNAEQRQVATENLKKARAARGKR